MSETYKFKIVKSTTESQNYSIRDENGGDPRRIINEIVYNYNLEPEDIIGIKISTVHKKEVLK